MYIYSCKECGAEFSHKNKGLKFCSSECFQTQRAYPLKVCISCGKSFNHRNRHSRPGNYCSFDCRSRGGFVDSLSGYRHMYRPGSPKANKNGFGLEHRFVMDELMGGELRDDEVVHHINGDKLDNSIGNLMAMSRSAHMTLHARGKL